MYARASALALIPILASALHLAAQQHPDSLNAQDSTPVYRLPPVSVTVTRRAEALQRVPQAISVVNARDIQAARSTVSLNESLSLVPGLVIGDRYNFTIGPRIAIRGFGSRAAFGVRGVRVLVDGIPLTNADGQAKLNSIDLGTVGEIEVLRGPASTLYGNAAGGVISVRTEAPPSVPLAGEIRYTAGDYGATTRLGDLGKWQVTAGGQSGAANYLASFARTATDGFREHSAARLSVFNGTGSYQLRRGTSVNALVNVTDMPEADNPGGLPFDSARLRPRAAWPTNVRLHAGEDSRQIETGVRLQQELGSAARADLTVYGFNRTVANPTVTSIIDLNRHAGGVRSTVSADGHLGALAAGVVAGVDVESQRDARREYANASGLRGTQTRDQIDRVTAIGPFAEVHVAPAPRLTVTGGVRYDNINFVTDDRFLSDGNNSGARRMGALSPKLSLLYSAGNAFNVYGTVATSFQTPTTTELINSPPATGQTCCAGGFNQALNPERSLSWETGAKGNIADWLRYDVAAFTMAVRDEIVSFQVAQAPGRDFYRNAGMSRHRGLEMAVEAAPTSFLRLGGAYTYSRFVFIDDGLPAQAFEGHLLPGIPSHQLTGRVTVLERGLRAEFQGQHVSRMFVNDANTASNPAYTVYDVRLQADRGLIGVRLAPFVAVQNLFDKHYNGSVVVNATGARYFEPAPGRNLLLGLRLPTTRWPY